MEALLVIIIFLMIVREEKDRKMFFGIAMAIGFILMLLEVASR